MTRSSFARCRSAALCLCAVLPLAGHAADPPAWPDPVSSPAETMPLAARSLLLDAVRVGDGYLVVGDRGHVLRSSDGRDWTQSDGVPVRVLLTAATARGDSVWAVGHDGVIVYSADGGAHWTVQHRDIYEEGAPVATDPRHGAPLLDVLFVDDRHGIAVGAYSRMLVTRDGGATWQSETLAAATANASAEPNTGASTDAGTAPADAAQDGHDGSMVFSEDELALGEESDPHLNAIVRTGSGGLMILAERGSAFRSRDDGATWQRIQLPYDGSMFGAIGYAGDRVLAFGLRGNVFETTDLGDRWTRRDSDSEQGLMGGSALDGEGAVLVGANGAVLMRRSADAPFKAMAQPGAGMLAGAVPLDGHRLLLVGENGISEVELP